MLDYTVCLKTKFSEDLLDSSTIENCSKCDEAIWVSWSTRKSIQIKLYPSILVCFDCLSQMEEKNLKIRVDANLILFDMINKTNSQNIGIGGQI